MEAPALISLLAHVHPDDPDHPSVMLGWVHNSVSSHQHRRADSAATRPWRGERSQKTRAGGTHAAPEGSGPTMILSYPPYSPVSVFPSHLVLSVSSSSFVSLPSSSLLPTSPASSPDALPKNLICHQGSTGGTGFVNRL